VINQPVAVHPAPIGVARSRAALPREPKTSFGLLLVYALWAILLFDLHYFLGNVVAAPLGRVATLVYIPLLGLIFLQGPAALMKVKAWVWYAPYLVLLVAAFAGLAVASNLAMAKIAIQYLVLFYVMALATAMYVTTPKQALPILAMFAWRFLWWGAMGATGGRVLWHPTLANYDGYGGLMVQGVGVCFWFALAVPGKFKKLVFFALAGVSVVGVIASMARGAFLALVAVGLVVWLRSPRKLVTGLGILVGVIVTMIAAAQLFEDRPKFNFWREMGTAFEEGADEGTGAHRWEMWMSAVKMWSMHPIFGVGANNFGIAASEYFREGEVKGFENPLMFWGINLHSSYFQILSEFGTVGVVAFAWLMWDFLTKNLALHKPESHKRWEELGFEGKYKLRYVALGIEAGMLGTFLGNAVYASLFEPWFITLWAANRMMWAVTRPPGAPVKKKKKHHQASLPPPGWRSNALTPPGPAR